MKLKSLLVASLFATCAALAAESAPVTFTGVLSVGKELRFGLVNEGAARSAWVKLGGEFDGYTLKSYDAAKHVLTLEREGKTSLIELADEKFTGAAATAATKASLADAQAVIDQMQFEKMIEKSMEGQKKMMEGMAKQMAARAGGKVSAEDISEHQKRVMDVMIEAMNPAQMKQDMAKIYSEMFSKEELASIGAFNSTPAGKAMIEKQPDVQAKLQELMMPRIMGVMPKIQQMGMEFGKQQAEKAKAAAAASGAAAAPSVPAATPASATKP